MNDPKSRSKGIFIASTSLVHEYPFTFQTSTLRHFRIIIQHFHASMRIFSSRGNISRRRSVDSPLSAIIRHYRTMQNLASFGARLLPMGAIRLRRCAIALSGNTRSRRGYVLTALRAYTALFRWLAQGIPMRVAHLEKRRNFEPSNCYR